MQAGEGRGQGAALLRWCHMLQDGERPRSLAVPWRGGRKAQAPKEAHPPGSLSPKKLC